MAEFLNREVRVNETTEQLATLLSASRGRLPAVPVQRAYTTAPNGEVLDRFGHIVYTPTPRTDKKAP